MFSCICYSRLLLKWVQKSLLFLVAIASFGYVFVPISLVYYPRVVDIFVFLNHAALPFTRNFSDLSHFGLDHAHATAHEIFTDDGVKLGAWYIQPPDNVAHRHQVILYHHGNSGTRGTPHRIALYLLFAEAGFDVVTFDYRGYADSCCTDPTEEGLVIDSKTMYKWTLQQIKSRWNGNEQSLIIWGHSLGGGAASNFARAICPNIETDCANAKALILEATFNNIASASIQYPLAWPLSVYEPALTALTNAMLLRNLKFNNTEALMKVRLPVLMVHAEDDLIVPAALSRQAFVAADAKRPDNWPAMEYKLFPSKFGYGHRSLHEAPDLMTVVDSFLNRDNSKK